MTQNESCDKRQLFVVELAVGSEQKLYYFCYELYWVRDVLERV